MCSWRSTYKERPCFTEPVKTVVALLVWSQKKDDMLGHRHFADRKISLCTVFLWSDIFYDFFGPLISTLHIFRQVICLQTLRFARKYTTDRDIETKMCMGKISAIFTLCFKLQLLIPRWPKQIVYVSLHS